MPSSCRGGRLSSHGLGSYELPIQAPAALLVAIAREHLPGDPKMAPPPRHEGLMQSPWVRVQLAVFLTLMGSYAYFWHSRDWNAASRLILTYALVDRGTVCLTAR